MHSQNDHYWTTNFNLRVEQNKILEFFGAKSKDTITIKRMYQVATTAQREFKGKGPALVNIVRDEEIPTENETDDVAAFNEGPGPKPIKPVIGTIFH